MDPTIVVLYLFLLRPPRPELKPKDSIGSVDATYELQFKLTPEEFICYPILAFTVAYWWTQITPRPNQWWEITSVVLLKSLTVMCYWVLNKQRVVKTVDVRKQMYTPQIVCFIVLAALTLLLSILGISGVIRDATHHPIFATGLFIAVLFVFMAFQFNLVHLENEL